MLWRTGCSYALVEGARGGAAGGRADDDDDADDVEQQRQRGWPARVGGGLLLRHTATDTHYYYELVLPSDGRGGLSLAIKIGKSRIRSPHPPRQRAQCYRGAAVAAEASRVPRYRGMHACTERRSAATTGTVVQFSRTRTKRHA